MAGLLPSLWLVLPRAAVVGAVAHLVQLEAHRPVAEAVQLRRRVAPQRGALCKWADIVLLKDAYTCTNLANAFIGLPSQAENPRNLGSVFS